MLFAGCAALSAGLSAQSLSLDQAYAAALKQSEKLGLQEQAMLQAREHVRQAWGSMAPTLNGSAYENWNFSPQGQYSSVAGASSLSQPILKASLNQPLFRGGREYAAIHLTRSLEDTEKMRLEEFKADLYSDVAAAYFLVQSNERDLGNLKEESDLFDERIKELKGRVQIGRSQNSEVLSVEAAAAALDAARAQIEGQLAVARENLAFLTGLGSEALLLEEPMADAFQEAGALEAAESGRPDVRLAESRLRSAEWNVGLNRGVHWPNLDFNANYSYYTQGIGAPAGQSGTNDSLWDAQILLTLPIFAGLQGVSKVREAESVELQAKLELALVRRQARQQLRVLALNAKSSTAQIVALKKAFQLSQRNYETQRHNYGLGLVSNLDVLQALISFQENRRSLDRAGFQLKNTVASLRAASYRLPH